MRKRIPLIIGLSLLIGCGRGPVIIGNNQYSCPNGEAPVQATIGNYQNWVCLSTNAYPTVVQPQEDHFWQDMFAYRMIFGGPSRTVEHHYYHHYDNPAPAPYQYNSITPPYRSQSPSYQSVSPSLQSKSSSFNSFTAPSTTKPSSSFGSFSGGSKPYQPSSSSIGSSSSHSSLGSLGSGSRTHSSFGSFRSRR